MPVCIHLDHGNSVALCMRALRAGYTSLMMDGSLLPYEENVATVGLVASAGKACGVPVEGELGKVGGKEDSHDGGAGGYTDPQEALDFVRRTGVTSLAVAIGTAHGVYHGVPKLDVERLKETVRWWMCRWCSMARRACPTKPCARVLPRAFAR